MDQVLVTGMGVVSSIGCDIDDFCNALKSGTSGIRKVKNEFVAEEGLPVSMAALLSEFDFSTHLEKFSDASKEIIYRAKRCARRAPISIQTSVISALQAWQQAGLLDAFDGKEKLAEIDTTRVSLIVAGQNISQQYSYKLQHSFQNRLEYLPPQYGLHFLDTSQVGVLSEIFKIKGEGYTVGGASASGNLGIIQGYRLVQSGAADICMVIGALADLSPLELQAWKAMGATAGKVLTDPEQACRPFDRDHEGFVYGQGCACLILESGASAARRSIEPIAEIAGTAMCLDGNHLPNPDLEGEIRAMREAIRAARMTPNDIQYLNAHGTASVLGDETEVEAIKSVFTNKLRDVWVNSTKSLIGHCIYAAGVLEAVTTILQLERGFLHPNLNLVHPIDSECLFVGNVSKAIHLNVAMSNSFGFGGINSSIVFRR